ncbi:MAG: tyrosine-type recombinase/integrase [Xanthomarina gelatinilytica]|uniref:tyrosine-type recombinase/integrase n=1 Tax=Xanthomarina gelatinilytica TaxID=1137281 RepID=UPI003A84EFD6
MRSEPKFYLKNNKATSKTPIMLNLKVLKENFRYSIQKSIEPELWDKASQRPTKEKKLINEYKKHIPTVKEDLKDIENRIINIDRYTRQYLNLIEQNNEIIDTSKLRQHLDLKYKKIITNKPSKKQLSINNYIDYFLNGIESGKILISSGKNFGQKYDPSTVKTWKEWKTLYNQFQESYGQLKWEDIDLKVYEDIINFFYAKDQSINTVGKFFKNLKAILRRAYRESHHSNNIFDNPEFRVLKEEVDSVVLTKKELKRLEKLKIEDSTLDFHRDLFLIGCYTALRVSDILRLKKAHIKEGKFIRIRMKKVTDPVVIPVSKKLHTILKKFNYEIPKVNRQDYGVNIKALCKEAKIDELIEIKSSKGGSISYLTKPKHSLIASHSARRTGATLMFFNGIPPLLIMKITGHKKEKTFMSYIKISKDEAAKLLAKNSYFA